ncbi:hypothetical protein QPK87_06985 [Kamptonema cortianum]|nr:hypothetical protein [Geitlerinema splendidum]MDK3156318.1 hypothetical protein [Kamptonema cortianum]
MVHKSTYIGFAVALNVSLCTVAIAQTHGYSDALGGSTEVGSSSLRLHGNSYAGRESNPYVGGAFTYQFREALAFQVRGGFASRSTHSLGFPKETGGTDLEARILYYCGPYFFAIGGAMPDTPAQDEAAWTATAGWRGTREEGAYFAGLTMVTSDTVTLLGVGGAARIPLNDRFGLEVSGTAVVRGPNTVSIVDGSLEQRPLWSAAFRYMANDRTNIWFGMGNALGESTGLSLTPRLSRGSGIGFGFEVKF